MAEIQVHEPAAARTDGGGPKPAGSDPTHDSLFKNAYFLMLSTGVSAVLGLGFWLVAARYYTEEAVGQGSAAIAAMRLLASITATTMIGAVVRFVPRAGRETGRLVGGTYVASSLVVALAAAVFLLTLDAWGASYAPLGTPMAGAVFVAACVAWALLTLQDGVLTGLRKAEWVPAGNAVFSVGKLALLAVFAGTLPVLGIFVSWAAAIAFSTLPLGWLIFRRLIPRQAEADRDKDPPKIKDMGRFLAGDSLGALFSLAMINLLPVMVAVRFSAAENGYFYVAYTVGGTMEFMAINMASSLTAHASHDPRQLADGVRGALRRMTLLLVPVVAVLVVFAPYILTPFSPDYAEHGSTVLRLLALGALPRVVVELYIGVLRVQGRTGVLAALQGAMCALVLGSAAMLFTPSGIAGAGWAVLLSMTLIAVVSMAGLRAALRHDDTAPPVRTPTGPAYGTHWAKLNATAGYGTTWARRAAHQPRDGDQDTVTLFIGRPGYEREALQADTLALIVRSEGPTREPPHHEPREPDREPQERRLRGALWSLLAVAALFFLAPLRDLPWLDGVSRAALTGRQLLEGLPLPSLTAGGLLLVVFVAAVTLSTRHDPWLPGTALGAALLALYAAPVALGREPRPVEGALYEKTAGFLADAVGLDGPEPLLRWAPPAFQLLCLVPLGLLLARAGGRLAWPGRWGVVYLVAVGGWVWRDALAPLAPPLLVALTLLLLLHRAASAWARSRTTASTGPRTTASTGPIANRTAGGPPSGPPRD
ncbi:O-antigen/teichoic acid export membrane protein [Streptomyces luteogriseus]|uniref:O-antigen/teichoic acid export membrane protein n=1 Tax=Streptomyces luteogriseus TaxID=68233 RepID=A0A7W7DMR0_9ACTN|nr:lipopolysaccharide biosynthesis protein [Streptomyces luteogriseus]MBB4713308.1 O-antigen/teichoic acid export membrane protein [Streptomyces luteogriseus]